MVKKKNGPRQSFAAMQAQLGEQKDQRIAENGGLREVSATSDGTNIYFESGAVTLEEVRKIFPQVPMRGKATLWICEATNAVKKAEPARSSDDAVINGKRKKRARQQA